MGDALTQCPECGAETADTEWCDECGASLADSHVESGPTSFTLNSESDPNETVKISVLEVLESYPGRRTLLAEVSESSSDTIEVGESVIVEEKSVEDARPFAIPSDVIHLFRRPIASMEEGQVVVQAYRDVAGMSLADLVSIASGRLSFRQIVDVFLAVCDSVSEAHERGFLILALSPWTVRVEGGDLERRARRDEQTLVEEQPVPTAELDDEVIDAALDETSIQEDVSEPDLEVENDNQFSIAESTDRLVNELGHSVFENVRATFEGIDFIIGIDEEPDEVPVIMGFSAPEFFGPYAREIVPSCDIFAMGMLLYFLACGRIPPSSIYSRHAPAFGFRALRAGFPPGLQPVISKATHPLQSERFETVAEMRIAFLTACEKIDQRVRRVGEPVPRPKLRLAVETHIGISKRLRNPVNQDAVFGKVSDDGAFSLIVVADGVSTAEYGSGDLASAFLVEEAERVWEELLPRYLMDDEIDPILVIGDLLEQANHGVVNYVNEHFAPFSGNPHEVMGSTAVISIYHNGFMTSGSLGDSRIYLYNELGLEQLTVDHNLWTLSIIEGVPPDSAMGMPHGDALARCLGTFRISDGELYAIRPEPDYYRFVALAGDTVLMTTDGLVDFGGAHKLESERNIENVLRSEPLPELAALEMILLANRGGGGDNIGVGVLKFDGH